MNDEGLHTMPINFLYTDIVHAAFFQHMGRRYIFHRAAPHNVLQFQCFKTILKTGISYFCCITNAPILLDEAVTEIHFISFMTVLQSAPTDELQGMF